MKKALKLITIATCYHIVAGQVVQGPHSRISGNVSGISGNVSGIYGNVSGISGNVSGISGNVSGIYGNVSGIYGNVDGCDLTEGERKNGVSIRALIAEPTTANEAAEPAKQ